MSEKLPRYQEKRDGARRHGFARVVLDDGTVEYQTKRPTVFCARCYLRGCQCEPGDHRGEVCGIDRSKAA